VHADVGDDAARRDDVSQVMKEDGTPTASMAVSTPRPPVIFMTAAAAASPVSWTTAVAPNCLAASSRFASG